MSDAPPSIARMVGLDGVIVGVAVDHRDSFHAALAAGGVTEVDDALVTEIKVDVCAATFGAATMLLIDESTFRASEAAHDCIAYSSVVFPLEAQGYGALHEVVHTRLLDGVAAGAAEAGAVACKLLLPYRPDHVERAEAQRTVAAAAIAMCHAVGVPLILEPIVWTAPDEQLAQARLTELVVETAETLAQLQPGLLKLQYPGSRAACDQVHAACGGHPWVLLGGGAPLAELEDQVADACAAGALGCIVGRSLWHGALTRDVDARRTWLRDVASPALHRLAEIAATAATAAGEDR